MDAVQRILSELQEQDGTLSSRGGIAAWRRGENRREHMRQAQVFCFAMQNRTSLTHVFNGKLN
jgi:hypothetical protein